jgi:hypothetical protein
VLWRRFLVFAILHLFVLGKRKERSNKSALLVLYLALQPHIASSQQVRHVSVGFLFQITLPQTTPTNTCTARLACCRSFFKQSQGETPREAPRAQIESARTGELMHAFGSSYSYGEFVCCLFGLQPPSRCCCGVVRSSARELVRWLR